MHSSTSMIPSSLTLLPHLPSSYSFARLVGRQPFNSKRAIWKPVRRCCFGAIRPGNRRGYISTRSAVYRHIPASVLTSSRAHFLTHETLRRSAPLVERVLVLGRAARTDNVGLVVLSRPEQVERELRVTDTSVRRDAARVDHDARDGVREVVIRERARCASFES